MMTKNGGVYLKPQVKFLREYNYWYRMLRFEKQIKSFYFLK